MLFGSKETFAIEAMTESKLCPPSAVWGRMQVWCRGSAIGDITCEHCALYPAYLRFKALWQSLPTLWLLDFEGLSDTSLWNFLDGLLYDADDERALEHCRWDWQRYGKFNFLTNWGEQFDGNGKSFIVRTPSGAVRVLNQSLPNGISCEVSQSEVLAAISGYVSWFESESLRLKGGADA